MLLLQAQFSSANWFVVPINAGCVHFNENGISGYATATATNNQDVSLYIYSDAQCTLPVESVLMGFGVCNWLNVAWPPTPNGAKFYLETSCGLLPTPTPVPCAASGHAVDITLYTDATCITPVVSTSAVVLNL